jgi:hypothetical protein
MQAEEEVAFVKVVVPPEDAEKLKAISADRFAIKVTFKSAHGKRSVWASDDLVSVVMAFS